MYTHFNLFKHDICYMCICMYVCIYIYIYTYIAKYEAHYIQLVSADNHNIFIHR